MGQNRFDHQCQIAQLTEHLTRDSICQGKEPRKVIIEGKDHITGEEGDAWSDMFNCWHQIDDRVHN